jgi:hypothetical protein
MVTEDHLWERELARDSVSPVNIKIEYDPYQLDSQP